MSKRFTERIGSDKKNLTNKKNVLFFCSGDIIMISIKYHDTLLEGGFGYVIGTHESAVQRLDSFERDYYTHCLLYRWINTV